MKIQKRTISIIAIYFLISLLVFLPILPNINSRIISTSVATHALDATQNIWNFWWAKKTCLGFCGDFWQTNYQFFPNGSSLIFHTFSFPNLILLLPFTYLGLTVAAAYNISLFLAVFTSMIAMYFLGRYLFKKHSPAFIAGLIYGISPYMIGHLIDGQLNLSTIQFFPLFILFILRSFESDKKINSIVAGLLLFLIGINDYTHLIFGMMMWLIFVVVKIIKRNYSSENFRQSLLTMLTFLSLFLPFSFRAITQYSNFNLSGETKWNAFFSSADLSAYFTPPPINLMGRFVKVDYGNFSGIYSDKSLFIGIILLMLGSVAIYKNRTKLFPWLTLLVFGLLLSLGPKLLLFKNTTIGPMPYELFSKVPVLNVLRAPSRFGLLVFLSLSIIAGYGFLYLYESVKSKQRILLLLSVSVLILFEYFPFYLEAKKLEIPAVYKKIKEIPAKSSILEVPTTWISGLESKSGSVTNSLYYQTFHEKKMGGGYITRLREVDFKSYMEYPLLNYVVSSRNRLQIDDETRKTLESYQGLDTEKLISNNKFDYLIINTNEIDLRKDKLLSSLVSSFELYYKDDKYRIYKINN